MSNILALDLATRISGYCIFLGDNLKSYGKITPSSKDIGKRFCEIKKTIKDLIDIFKIDKVYFEDILLQENVGNNVLTFKVLALLLGMLITMFTEMNIPYEIVHSTTWKSHLRIDGKSRKLQKANALAYVNKIYSILASEDEADAICIATYARTYKPPFDWSK